MSEWRKATLLELLQVEIKDLIPFYREEATKNFPPCCDPCSYLEGWKEIGGTIWLRNTQGLWVYEPNKFASWTVVIRTKDVAILWPGLYQNKEVAIRTAMTLDIERVSGVLANLYSVENSRRLP